MSFFENRENYNMMYRYNDSDTYAESDILLLCINDLAHRLYTILLLDTKA